MVKDKDKCQNVNERLHLWDVNLSDGNKLVYHRASENGVADDAMWLTMTCG